MKKIAADKNYKILKSSAESPEAERERRVSEIEGALRNIQETTGAPTDAAYSVFSAIQKTALIHSRCTEPGLYYGSIELPECEGELNKLLGYTEDALSGMKDPVWKKYTKGLFDRLYDVNDITAAAIIAFIAVRNISG